MVVGSVVNSSMVVELGSGDDRLDNVADSVETATVCSTVYTSRLVFSNVQRLPNMGSQLTKYKVR